MTKKTFIALADALRLARPPMYTEREMHSRSFERGRQFAWAAIRDELADFCQSQNSRFDRKRWLAYIAGECGPNGGRIDK